MRTIAADLKTGKVGIFDVPEPELRAGGVLVRTEFSAISSGTERNTIDTSKKSLLGKALARPDLVKQVVESAKANGVLVAYQKVRARLDSFSSLGYSSSGTILAVADGISEFMPGDRVACAGAGYAGHSEVNFVPTNLVVKVPATVPMDAASLTTIGSIAMQGLRQGTVALGETVLVVGTGLLGVLAIQLARSAGCRVIAVDRDTVRVAKSLEFGAQLALNSDDPSLHGRIQEFSKYGPDVAIITAASNSVEPVELAAKVLRDRGRIIVLGAVPLGVSREIMYRKELSLILSRSYGPGRYDPNYEESGNDYPVGYVRWTERRNMESFLDLLAAGTVKVESLLGLRYDINHGIEAYDEIERSGAYTGVISYASPNSKLPAIATTSLGPSRIVPDTFRVGCIGAGNFARSVIFPALQKVDKICLQSIGSANGLSAMAAQRTFGFKESLQPSQVLSSAEVDAVFVLSQHDTHARYVVAALNNQKPVFVEKPLAIHRDELSAIRDTYQEQIKLGNSPFVMVGFNRRFAPATKRVRDFYSGRLEAMVVNIRVNAGYLARDHWTQQKLNGGRIIGEACHFVDWARAVIDVPILRVYASATPDAARYNRDNIVLTLSFADGSIANILYLANGDRSLGKELYEVFCEGAVARIEDFRRLEFYRGGKRQIEKLDGDKGHKEEILLTATAMQKQTSAPISFPELAEVCDAVFCAVDSLQYQLPVELGALATNSSFTSKYPLSFSHSE